MFYGWEYHHSNILIVRPYMVIMFYGWGFSAANITNSSRSYFDVLLFGCHTFTLE